MQTIIRSLLGFIDEEDGTTAVEYTVMLALIVGVCIGTVSALATATAGSFDTSANAIAGAFGN
ncbi:MAG: Flp family type IVb pilin [Planctomycetota bacterium]